MVDVPCSAIRRYFEEGRIEVGGPDKKITRSLACVGALRPVDDRRSRFVRLDGGTCDFARNIGHQRDTSTTGGEINVQKLSWA